MAAFGRLLFDDLQTRGPGLSRNALKNVKRVRRRDDGAHHV